MVEVGLPEFQVWREGVEEEQWWGPWTEGGEVGLHDCLWMGEEEEEEGLGCVGVEEEGHHE